MNERINEDTRLMQEKLISQLIRHHHISTIGVLMQGLVHNMNGPLQVLSIQIELLKKIVAEEERIISDLAALPLPAAESKELLNSLEQKRELCLNKLGQLEEEMERLQDLTALVANRCNPDEDNAASFIDLNEVIRNEVALLHADLFFKHKIQKKLELAESVAPISGRYLDLCQVLNYILQNAIEALSDEERRDIIIRTGEEHDKVFLTVEDSGCGMPAAVQAKLFTPFQTTKAAPHAGLGLFLARRILEPLGGDLKIESQPGMTRVTIYFPRKDQEEI